MIGSLHPWEDAHAVALGFCLAIAVVVAVVFIVGPLRRWTRVRRAGRAARFAAPGEDYPTACREVVDIALDGPPTGRWSR